MSWWRKNTVANFCWCIRKCYFSFLFCPRILVRCACMWTSIQDNKWCKWYALVWLCNDDSNNVTEFITKKRQSESGRKTARELEHDRKNVTREYIHEEAGIFRSNWLYFFLVIARKHSHWPPILSSAKEHAGHTHNYGAWHSGADTHSFFIFWWIHK